MEGVILGDVSVALCVLGRFLPGGGAFRVIAVIPFAAVAARHRLRAVVGRHRGKRGRCRLG
jgi:hypothetical protein